MAQSSAPSVSSSCSRRPWLLWKQFTLVVFLVATTHWNCGFSFTLPIPTRIGTSSPSSSSSFPSTGSTTSSTFTTWNGLTTTTTTTTRTVLRQPTLTRHYIFRLEAPSTTKSSTANDEDSSSSSSSSSSNNNNNYKGGDNDSKHLPYIIERIGEEPNERVYREVAEVCINVFFKEQLDARPEDRVPPWKEAQISYLKTLQTGDLKLRRKKYPHSNEMFLAYEAIPATAADLRNKPLILDTQTIYNLPPPPPPSTTATGYSVRNTAATALPDEQRNYVRGRLLGFCEVTQRPYGLGNDYRSRNRPKRPQQQQQVNKINNGDDNNQNDETSDEDDDSLSEIYRPVLTNLAVAADARKYGIGSKLVDECERQAGLRWKMNEIVLEVEDYNDKALEFYRKRGYQVVFCDPASRRFDVGGIMLKKVRCTRQILRKDLTLKRALMVSEEEAKKRRANNGMIGGGIGGGIAGIGLPNFPSFDFLQRFRQTAVDE